MLLNLKIFSIKFLPGANKVINPNFTVGLGVFAYMKRTVQKTNKSKGRKKHHGTDYFRKQNTSA